ncbi:transmembrane channel-like protein 7 [Eurytemora carolleeae]|uniref:transmembrane channel-like protein 7 n=1 Tax=Eurytemora carolleeae TaxID=1294199 RepID=UPI000C78F5EE|nr:transmembrane channel-like protein 7 [Eurytemora carolleeae]|eukprot:XP_023332672.1 transmembrane channel-like protein 7 [Eurytemora affinis]
MLSLLVSLVPYGVVLTQIESSRGCGPFSNQDQTKPLYAMKFLQQAFLFQPTFVAFFVVVALMICYYARSLAISRKRYGKTLSRQLKMAVKELKLLKKDPNLIK